MRNSKKCPHCGGESKIYRKIWVTIAVAILFFPFGLVYLFVPRHKCKTCKNLFN